MTEFTTIQVTKELKDKLTEIKKKEGKKYNDIIEDMLYQQGTEVDDVITITREPVAFTLKYWDKSSSNILEVTYSDLRKSKVGAKFIASNNTAGDKWVNSNAKIIFKDAEDVVLMVSEVSYDNGFFNVIKSVVHVKLF